MTSLRGHVHRHRWLAAALIIMTLLITILVPAGYMPSMVDGAFVMRPCDGQRAPNPMADMVMPSGDHAHADRPDHHDGDGSPDRFNTPCVFSSLSTPALSPVDPLLLAIAIAFIIATVFRAAPTRIFRHSLYLRPPSQGPPAAA